MQEINLGFELSASDVEFTGLNFDVRTMPEREFFALQRDGEGDGMTLPLPDGVRAWGTGLIKGVSCFVARTEDNSDLYIVTDSDEDHYTLHHYEYQASTEGYRKSYNLPERIIQKRNERKTKTMASINDILQQQQQSGLRSMNLNTVMPQQPTVMPQQPTLGGDGVGSNNMNLYRIQNTALSKGYVAGYIMGVAPAVTMRLVSYYEDKQHTKLKHRIEAKESKPSKLVRVLVALPKRCVMRGNNLATPAEIMQAQVNFDTISDQEMIYLAMEEDQAHAYISALGGKLPEYAPFVSDEKAQWDADAIRKGREGVTYVRIKVKHNDDSTSAEDRLKFSLVSTSPRRSLYTQKNVCCLRAYQHVSTNVSTPKEAMELNKIAFGSWQYGHKKDSNETSLDIAYADSNGAVFERPYDFGDGAQNVLGIGSVFFTESDIVTNKDGKQVRKQDLEYIPWYVTGVKREERESKKVAVRSLMKRVETTTKTGNTRMTNVPIVYDATTKNDPQFRPYAQFVDFITKTHSFISLDDLYSLKVGKRGAKGKSKKSDNTIASIQRENLFAFLNSNSIRESVERIQKEVVDNVG